MVTNRTHIMIKHFFGFLFLALAAIGQVAADSSSLDIRQEKQKVLVNQVGYLKEITQKLTAADAIEAYQKGFFQESGKSFLNFGIGSQPVWIAFTVHNPTPGKILRRLLVENSWLDEIEVYFLHGGKIAGQYHTGDRYPSLQRPVQHRFFAFDHAFVSGTSTVFIRVQTPDPLMLPIYLMSKNAAQTRQALQGYSYGFVYGFIIALALYNAILFFSLRNVRYLYYSIYLLFFLVLNISYSGHGYRWLWSESADWQIWLNPVLMVAYAFAGLLFATRFLETRRNFPRVHRAIGYMLVVVAVSLGSLIAINSHVGALYLAFSFMFVFTSIMLFLGAISLYSGFKPAKYFLLASVSAMIGVSVTALAVWGGIPYNAWTYRAAEIGMLIDSVLLAMALADQFRISQEEKLLAEKLAKVDPLTGMNNRRAFYDATRATWSTAVRHDRDIAVILMDIDHFKRINDSYGHANGDKVLIKIARFLLASARDGDILARWGGEEFILFLPETDVEEATSIAERLRKAIKNVHIAINDESIVISASFGVACKTTRSLNLDEVISLADAQLYRAKHEGRDRVCTVPGYPS